ncbi:DUF7529 family protein [Natronolimnohabitans innermongolicus]|uniref:Uncharacterized protein n=1 Tax=Natronolimnohabitans innermongolicus JCM 12255 TaxID=1227499 RepID=L9X4V5_9EURY|nr:hypothetical protein [Natronolimnohabitans innermongolicus]ELY56647.1 hypothetical protein C493_09745 [Natronolimnohabitans innermongolicus JCM 12255]
MTSTTGPRWTTLLEDAAAIADEYRDSGWDVVVLEPEAVTPVEDEARTGFDVRVSTAEYDLVADLIDDGPVTVTAADVYYRPPDADDGRRVALAVERDEETETAVFVPLAYDLEESRSLFETALLDEELLVHVLTDETDGWVSFSHDDPSLFLEESDIRRWDR